MTKKEDSIKTRMAQGEALFLEGRVEEAEQYFLVMLEETPGDAEILNNLGAIYHAKGKADIAETYFLMAIKKDSTNIDARLNIVNLLQETDRRDETVTHLEKILETCADDFNIHNQLGTISLETGELEKAYMYLAKSLRLNPQQEEIRKILTHINNRLLSVVNSNNDNNRELPASKAHPPSHKDLEVSIGFTVYNGGEATKKAVESILAQEFRDFELIISDNASTDNTSDICREYERLDKRIRYIRQPVNLGLLKNMYYVLGQARGEYFMWMQHDNWHDPRYLSVCMQRYVIDDGSTLLVYPRTKVYQGNDFIRIEQDNLEADMDNPVSRFRQVIYKLGMCNAILGLFRKNALIKSSSLYTDLYRGGDHLYLAELALSGKITQLPEALFNRVLTRNYQVSEESMDTKLIHDCVPDKANDGITFPMCRLVYLHLEMINRLDLAQDIKDFMLKDVIKCFRQRFGQQMHFEITRALTLIDKSVIYYNWGCEKGIKHSQNCRTFSSLNANILIRRLLEALMIFPELSEISDGIMKCSEFVASCQEKTTNNISDDNEKHRIAGGIRA